MPIEPGIELRKEVILSKVSQEQIFEAYLGLPVDTGTPYINPLRVDKSPGCRYYYNSLGKLYFKDFGKFHWDCFAVVQYKYNNCSFIEALRIIVRDFRLNGLAPTNSIVTHIPESKARQVIEVTTREWADIELKFWAQFNIDLLTLRRFNVFACKAVWINEQYYRCKPGECYAFYFGNRDGIKIFKLYFPNRDYNRFFQNIHTSDNFVMGIQQLPKTVPYLVITKSYKDVLSLHTFGIPAVSVLSENHLISDDLFRTLTTYAPYVITLFDNDSVGRMLARKYKNRHNTPYLLFPRGFRKDFSDNVTGLGSENIIKIIEYVKESYNKRLS